MIPVSCRYSSMSWMILSTRAILAEISRDAAGHARPAVRARRPLGVGRAGAAAPAGNPRGDRRLPRDPRPGSGGPPLSAFIEITPLDPAQPDNAPELLEHLDGDRGLPLDRGRCRVHAVRAGRARRALSRRSSATSAWRHPSAPAPRSCCRRSTRTGRSRSDPRTASQREGGSVVLRETQVQSAVRRVEPPRRDRLLLREEVEPVRAVGLRIAEE